MVTSKTTDELSAIFLLSLMVPSIVTPSIICSIVSSLTPGNICSIRRIILTGSLLDMINFAILIPQVIFSHLALPYLYSSKQDLHAYSIEYMCMWYKQASQKKLIIMRGISGSGKSTKAKELGADGVVLGSDDFWGEDYNFDRSKIGEAHEWNQNRVREALSNGISPVVVDNTNTQFWEMKPYVEMALEHGYEIEFEEPDTPWKFDLEELTKRNQHGTPRDIINQMLMNWQRNPSIEAILNSERPSAEPEENTKSLQQENTQQ